MAPVRKVKIRVQIPNGLHARPASVFVRECLRYKSRITIDAGGRRADGTSILQVLGLGVTSGQEILIRADGEDETEALAALVPLIAGLRG